MEERLALSRSFERRPGSAAAPTLCATFCRQERPARRLGLHRNSLRPGRCRAGQGPMAPRRRPAPAQGPQARHPDGSRRARRAGLHERPAQHRTKLHSTNPLERLNGETKRRTEVVGIFPNEAAITRASSGPSCSNRTINGPSNAPATSHWKASLPSAMIPSSAYHRGSLIEPAQPGDRLLDRRAATPRFGARSLHLNEPAVDEIWPASSHRVQLSSPVTWIVP